MPSIPEILRQAVAVIGHDKKLQRSVALLPWSHNMLLLSKGLDDDATLYYATKTVEKGWNRDLLLNAIKLKMYETQALARIEVELALEDMGNISVWRIIS